MATRFNLPHIDISSRAIARPYQAPQENRGGGGAPRIREQHGTLLQTQLATALAAGDALRTADDRLKPPCGVYLEVEIRGAKPDILEQRRPGLQPGASRIAANDSTTVALFVPDAARPVLDRILQDYTSGPLTAGRGNPRRKGLVEPIEAIRQARLETLWTDDISQLPSDPQQVIWWEVWCFAGMAQSVLNAAERLRARVAALEDRLLFPEATVVPILANRATIELMLFATVGISELRRASATPTLFLNQDATRKIGLAHRLAERTQWPAGDAPSVCLLDTGVNRGHVLLEPALAPTDMTTVHEEWGVTDGDEGHGTEMAGLALYGDLVAPLRDERQVVLTHRLESVKVLPPNGFPATDPKNYGAITQAATARAEIAAPDRRRSFCLAVTNENVSGTRPTTWSGAVDQAASGRMPGDDDNAPSRLFVISAGNAPAHIDPQRILSADDYPIEDPAQAWNALTVGGYTDKTQIDDDGYADWSPFAEAGEISPFTRTSVHWPHSKTAIKPELVMEAGNRAVSPARGEVLSVDSLALLTTGAEVHEHTLVSFSATSAAVAQAARIAAMLNAAIPNLWPETTRALMVHSAEWTERMSASLKAAGNKREAYSRMLRRFGYGVPAFERAVASASNHLALIAQNEITPFRSTNGRRFRDCHFYRLPWPTDVLEGLGEQDVRLKITLSYFIEPNPGASSAIDPQRYQSHGLRFDLRRRLESVSDFLERVNPLERDDPQERVDVTSDDGWRFGPQSIAAGSLHCDEWIGSAVRLASRNIICVKPVVGWWRSRGTAEQCNRTTRYALIATLSAPGIEIDLHTPIVNIVEQKIDVEITFGNEE